MEVSDVLWYVSQLARELGLDMQNIAEENISKVKERQKNNKLHGSGDNRWKMEELTVRDKRVKKLLKICREIRRLDSLQKEKTKKLQGLANEARRTGKSLSHLISHDCTVIDFGDVIEDLLRVLKPLDKIKDE